MEGERQHARRVFVVRHGNRLDFENQNWVATAEDPTDSPLSESGHEQAQNLARFLKEHANIKHIFSSPYLRTLQTAKPTAEAFGVPIFVEFGLSEGLGVNATHHPIEPEKVRWEEFNIDRTYTTICKAKFRESDHEIHERVMPIIQKIESDPQYEEGDVLLVTHAVTKICVVRGFLRDISVSLFPGTCTLSELKQRVDDLAWNQAALCSALHLPAGLQYSWGFPQIAQRALEVAFAGYTRWPSPLIGRKKVVEVCVDGDKKKESN